MNAGGLVRRFPEQSRKREETKNTNSQGLRRGSSITFPSFWYITQALKGAVSVGHALR